jgi:peptidoglycan/LPS O-acetylase OafA/YrhL
MVFIQHAIVPAFEHLNIKGTFWEALIRLAGNGAYGVSIFFVLSGFLITYLMLSERELYGKIHVLYFYVRRTLRIWPLYYAVITFAFILYPFFKQIIGIQTHLGSRPAYYFLFLSNFDVIHIQKYFSGQDSMSGNITWSVAIEEQFYLVWPILFYVLPKKFYRVIFLATIAASLIFRYVYADDVAFLYFHSLSVCSDLALGGLCAWYALYSEAFTDFLKRLPKIVIAAIYVLGMYWLLAGISQFRIPYANVFTRLVSTLFFAFVILEQNYCRHSLYKFSRLKTLSFWGKYTYGLYLLHPIALTMLDVAFRLLRIDYQRTFLSTLSAGLAALVISLLLSYVSYEYFEKRFLKLKKKFSFVRSAH